MSTANTDLATTVARQAPGIAFLSALSDAITPKSEPPYRATYMHLGLPEPTGKPPLRCVKMYPGRQTGTVLLDDDERGVWEYVLHLEAKVRELTAHVQQRQSAQECAEVEPPAPSEDVPVEPADSPQERAHDPNDPETANTPNSEPERAQRDSGAQEVVLEMTGSEGDGSSVSNAPLGLPNDARVDADPLDLPDGPTLRERVEAVLLKTPSSPNTAIAVETGCSDEYVRRTRKSLEAAGTLAPTPVVRSDGTLYMRTTSDNAPEGTDAAAP